MKKRVICHQARGFGQHVHRTYNRILRPKPALKEVLPIVNVPNMLVSDRSRCWCYFVPLLPPTTYTGREEVLLFKTVSKRLSDHLPLDKSLSKSVENSHTYKRTYNLCKLSLLQHRLYFGVFAYVAHDKNRIISKKC